jgi:NADPH-dependent 2,4-dienoyl-CoA reductase/sulfur reductase-like enzyme
VCFRDIIVEVHNSDTIVPNIGLTPLIIGAIVIVKHAARIVISNDTDLGRDPGSFVVLVDKHCGTHFDAAGLVLR